MSDWYFVEWHNPDARSWIDVLPADILQTTKEQRGLKHLLVSKKGETRIEATFDVERCADGTLLLKYGGRNASANEKVGVYVGDTLIDPTDFAKAKTLLWRDHDQQKFEPIRVTIWCDVLEGVPSTSTTRSSLKRSRTLKAIKQALGRHVGSCEACGYQGHPGYGDAKNACFQVHHLNQLAKGERHTGLNDLSYICANCHAVITALNIPFDDFVNRLQSATRASKTESK